MGKEEVTMVGMGIGGENQHQPLTASWYRPLDHEFYWCAEMAHFRAPAAVAENGSFYCLGCLRIAIAAGRVSLQESAPEPEPQPPAPAAARESTDSRDSSIQELFPSAPGEFYLTLQTKSIRNYLNALRLHGRPMTTKQLSEALGYKDTWIQELSRYLIDEEKIVRGKRKTEREYWYFFAERKAELDELMEAPPPEIVELLIDGPKPSDEMAEALGYSQNWLTEIMRSFKSHILTMREQTPGHKCWYALKEQSEGLLRCVGDNTSDRILSVLSESSQPLSCLEIANILDCSRVTVGKILLELTTDKQISRRKTSSRYVYSLAKKKKKNGH